MAHIPSTVRPLNIYDLYRNVQAKKMRKYATYDMILEKVYSRIQKMAEIDHVHMVYDVPNFIPGIPLYDVWMCTAYVIAQLRKNGFVVRYIPPTNLIYISWDFRELPIGRKQEDEVDRILSEQWPPAPRQPTAHVEAAKPKPPPRGRRGRGGGNAAPPPPPFTPEATSSRENKPVIAPPPPITQGFGLGSGMQSGYGTQNGYGMGHIGSEQSGYGYGSQSEYGYGSQSGYGYGSQSGYGGGAPHGYGSTTAIVKSSPFPESVARYKPSGKFVLNLS